VPSSTPPRSELVRRDSGLRRSVQPTAATPRPGDTVEEVAKADTIPAPSSRSAELAGRAVMAPVSPIEISGSEPSSRRFTVPYLPKALVRKSRTPAAVVVDADEGSREELCTWLRSMGCVVAAASDGAQARSLLRRSRAGLLIADVETIAPDYEPIGPVLEELVRGLDTVTVVLLAEEPQRARCAAAAVLPKPTSRARLLTTIEPLLARKRDQG
jgi:CheY-like chemotaxis protein